MEQEINRQQFNQPEQKEVGEMKKLIFVGVISSIVSVLTTGGIVYFVLSNLYLAKQGQLNNQISALQNQINAFEKQKEATKLSPTSIPSPVNNATNEAIINKGWKKFISNGKFVFSTDDWQSYSSKNDNASFSIEYPADWNLGGSVFYDSNGKKIAEFLPGLVVLQPGQKCFDANGKNETNGSELISQTNITIDKLHGALRIENWAGYWYPNIYCLSDYRNAFVMSFYEDKLNSDKRKLFGKIISTLRFE